MNAVHESNEDTEDGGRQTEGDDDDLGPIDGHNTEEWTAYAQVAIYGNCDHDERRERRVERQQKLSFKHKKQLQDFCEKSTISLLKNINIRNMLDAMTSLRCLSWIADRVRCQHLGWSYVRIGIHLALPVFQQSAILWLISPNTVFTYP